MVNSIVATRHVAAKCGPSCSARRSSTQSSLMGQNRASRTLMIQENNRRDRGMRMVVRAQDSDDEDFEARLAALKKAKGETPYGAGAKKGEEAVAKEEAPVVRDWGEETVYFEGGPHLGDVAVNVALGTTLVWLPLSIAAVGRAAFVKYKFTDRRISTITTAPWKNEQLDAGYEDVVDVKSIGRGIGLWGDMVVTLKDGSKIEMRSVPKYKELQEYIIERRNALKGSRSSSSSSSSSSSGSKGFA